MTWGLILVEELLNGIIDSAPQLAETAVELVGQLIQGLADKGPDLITSAVGMVSELVSGLGQGRTGNDSGRGSACHPAAHRFG